MSVLPLQLQHRIDHAFDRNALPDGGFLVEKHNSPGRSILDDHVSPSQIPLTSIPSALRTLDLPPDDEQILSVFRNAASGWTSSSNDVLHGKPDQEMVSRDDWRSVCAVLFEHYEEEYADDSEIGLMDIDGSHECDQSMASEGRLSASGNSDDSSDEDYVEGSVALSSRRRTHPRKAKFNRTSFSPTPIPSPRQQRSCLETFALFFPSISKSEIPDQKITIKDIQRVSKLLGEKINANEIIEMLEAFSTSTDKSVSFADFGRMMVAAKLT